MAEQTVSLQDSILDIDQLFAPDVKFCKWQLLVDPPGSEKTHILLIAQILARVLNAQMIVMTSERARRLGGEHIHLLFGIPVLENQTHTIFWMAETTLFYMVRNPIRLAALQCIDVLVI